MPFEIVWVWRVVLRFKRLLAFGFAFRHFVFLSQCVCARISRNYYVSFPGTRAPSLTLYLEILFLLHRVFELFERPAPARTSRSGTRSVPFDFGTRVMDAIVRFRDLRALVHEGDDSDQCDREGDHEGYHERDRDSQCDRGRR